MIRPEDYVTLKEQRFARYCLGKEGSVINRFKIRSIEENTIRLYHHESRYAWGSFQVTKADIKLPIDIHIGAKISSIKDSKLHTVKNISKLYFITDLSRISKKNAYLQETKIGSKIWAS